MPFKSEAQRRYMWVHHPEIARRWTEKYGSKPTRKNATRARAIAKSRKRG